MSCVVFTVGVVFSVITLIRRLDDENEVVKYMNKPTDETVWEEVVPLADSNGWMSETIQ